MIVRRIPNESELYHHGIKGQKWGVRRYQNEDGSLTALGRKRAGMDAYYSNKWATSKNQPSSVRTSIAASRYKVNPNLRNETRLNKLKERDAARYNAASKEYKNLSKDQKEKNAKEISKSDKRRLIASSSIGGALATKAVIDTVKNYNAANSFLASSDILDMKIPTRTLVAKSAMQALIVGGAGFAASYAGAKLGNRVIKNKKSNKNDHNI